MIENDSFWQYTGSGGSDWSWSPLSGMVKSNSSSRTELSIPLNYLTQIPSSNKLRLMIQDNFSTQPYSLVDIAPDDFANQFFEYHIQILSDIAWQDHNNFQQSFSLSQNYPNPFNPSTKISFSLPSASKIKLQVFNALGELVTTLVNDTKNAGIHTVNWNASNLASGVYIYRIQAESVADAKEFNMVKKMILMK